MNQDHSDVDTNAHPPVEPPPRSLRSQLPPKSTQTEQQSGREIYNLVTDTVAGLNFRMSDNLIQGVVILVFLVAGIVIGLLNMSAEDLIPGPIIGGFIGLVAGFLISGIGLMIYRGVRHLKGKHD